MSLIGNEKIMVNTTTALSTRIKELRKSKGLTQQAFAKKFEISKQTVSNYENNERTPDVDMLISISNHFDVSIDYLVGRTNSLEDQPVVVGKKLLTNYEKLNSIIGSLLDQINKTVIENETPNSETLEALKFLGGLLVSFEQ